MTTPTTGAAELPEALRIADELDAVATAFRMPGRFILETQAAAELRRLHRENEALRAQPAGAQVPEAVLQAIRAAGMHLIRGMNDVYSLIPAMNATAQPAGAATPAAPQMPAEQCLVCGETEPYSGSCGSNDRRALCKKSEATPAAPAPGVPAKQVIAWRVVHQSCLGHGDVKGDWIDGAPTEWQVNDFRQNAPGARIEYAYTAPQPAVTAGAVDARITAIEQAIRDYHYALDMRQHGGVAQDRAVNAICNAMGMHWTQGAEAAQAVREPLTEDQRSDIATAAAGFNWASDYVEAIDYVIDGVEQLHGITKGGQHG